MKAEQIKDLVETYGKNSNVDKVRLMGEAPDSNENAILGSIQIDEAFNRELEIKSYETIKLGVDAGKGNGRDSSVIYEKRDNQLRKILDRKDMKLPELKRYIIHYCLENSQKLVIVNVDGTGLGTGLAQELEEQNIHNMIINDVQFAAKAKNQKEFNNKRTEMYFELARNIDNLDIEEDQELKRELLVQIYAFDNKGRFALINKDKIKDMLGHSPDKSDALALCNYEFESENISMRGSLDDYM